MPTKSFSKEKFEELSKKIAHIAKEIEEMIPQTTIKETSSFGNSSHIVLSKEILGKKVGVIVFDDLKENERRSK